MSIEKSTIVKTYQRGGLDTGSPEVQVALLTTRITGLTGHFKTHQKDHHGKRGLMKLVARRRKLLDYLRKHHESRYVKLIEQLKIRK